MEEAVFIAQYTFLATPAVIEEESRILGKIARRLRCEYVIRFEDDGKFYFLLETRSGYEEHFARCGWYIVSQTDFNSRLTIGMGLYESGNLAGFMYRLDSGSEDEARFWNNILVFTFFNDFRKAFFPLDNRFQGFFRLDGSLCLYLYDYCPVRRNDKITFEGKKVSNAVWRFKSGEQTDLFVKLFSHIDRLAVAGGDVHAFEEGRLVVRLPSLAPSCVRRFPFLRLLHRHGGFPLSGSRFSRSCRLARHHPHQQFLVDGLLIPLLLHSLPV